MTDSVDLTAQGHARRRIALRLLLLAVTAIALYLVLPGLIAMFGSLPQLEAVFPAWFVPIFVLEAAAFACIWALMRIALHTDNWFDIACAQLTGNALSHALPGGAATGGATMFQMLTRAGFDGATTSTALTAVGLLSTATLFVLPVLALPAIVLGLAVRSELLQGALLGGALGIFLLTGASILLISDRVVRNVGRLFDWIVRRVLRRPTPDPSLSQRFVEARDFVRAALAENWKQAVPAALGNQLFDFLALYVSLLAVGSPRRSGARAARVRGRERIGDDPHHARRARVRRGGADRCARPGRGHPGARGAGDPALPAVLVLAPAAGGARRLDPLPPAPPHDHRRGLTRRAAARKHSATRPTSYAGGNVQRPAWVKLSRPAQPATRHALTTEGSTGTRSPYSCVS